MRALLLITLLSTTTIFTPDQFAAAAERDARTEIRATQLQYRNKAILCQQGDLTECTADCSEAVQLAANSESTDFKAAARRCDEAVAPLEERNKLATEGRLLQDGYQWMPDVEATVIRARGNPFQVEGRSEDWNKYCKSKLRYAAKSLGKSFNELIRSPGTKVLLKHVQYSPERKLTGQCVVGDIEVLSET